MANSQIIEILRDFLALFFPRYCSGCFGSLVKGEEAICTRCILEMPQTNHHLDAYNSLRNCLYHRIEVKHAMAFFKFSKSGRVQHLLHALKYNNQPEIGIILGRVYGEKLKEAGLSQAFDMIIPVPLHATRKRRRGYNQSAMFAKGLSEKLETPFSDEVVARTIITETQTLKTRLTRWQNVDEVFQVTNKAAVLNQRILLVDDVITTGATVEACGQVLRREGCSALSVASIAEA